MSELYNRRTLMILLRLLVKTNEFAARASPCLRCLPHLRLSLNTAQFSGSIPGLNQPTPYTYNFAFDTPLSTLDSATAGQANSASSGMPVGGIGGLAAARLSYLFDAYYAGSALGDWTQTDATPDTLAFQLAIWEITHDSNLSIMDQSGTFYLDPTLNTASRITSSVNLAQTWLDDINNSNIQSTYASQSWDIYVLKDSSRQDLIFALPPGSPVPEPSSAFLLFAAFGNLLLGRQRKKGR